MSRCTKSQAHLNTEEILSDILQKLEIVIDNQSELERRLSRKIDALMASWGKLRDLNKFNVQLDCTGSRSGMEVSGGSETSLAMPQDPQQGQLISSSADVDTCEHETLQNAHEVTDDKPETSVLTFPQVIKVSSLYLIIISIYIATLCKQHAYVFSGVARPSWLPGLSEILPGQVRSQTFLLGFFLKKMFRSKCCIQAKSRCS